MLIQNCTEKDVFGFVSETEISELFGWIVPQAMEKHHMNEALAVTDEMRCFEDFDKRNSTQKIDFYRKWYYVLTLAAIARGLNIAGLRSAEVCIVAGLPLTWVSEQKDEFKRYLLRHKTVAFTFRGKDYHIEIVGADVYPQGFAAVVNHLGDFSGINMLCDIGNGTMNLMFVNDKKPDPRRCFTGKFGIQQCILQIRENLMHIHHIEAPEEVLTRVLRFGTADIDEAYPKTIKETAEKYDSDIFRRLQEHGYDSGMMKLYVVGYGKV